MPEPRPPKKSESLEIRIPHDTKQAFMARCRTDGCSASETLRVFIDQHLDGPAPTAAEPVRPRRARRLALGALIAAAVGAVALPSLARPSLQTEFQRLDADCDGVVSAEEFSRGAHVQVQVSLEPRPQDNLGQRLALLSAGVPRPSGAAGLASEPKVRTWLIREEFARIDTDGDGAISLKEYRRYRGGAPEAAG